MLLRKSSTPFYVTHTTYFPTVATFHFQCKFPNFSFCLNQPHQRKWKYFHPFGIFSFKRFVSCQFTYWRPTHYLTDPFSITKQLCHWQLRSCITSCQIWLITCYSCECRQGQFRLLGSLSADTCFKFTVTWYRKTADSFELKDEG